MLPEEAVWLRESIISIHKQGINLSPILNIGSSTGKFRSEIQPYINSNLFVPLSDSGLKVVHCDLKSEEGVDMSGDIYDEAFFNSLKKYGFRFVICSNILEHVTKPEKFSNRIIDILDAHGYIFVTVPNRYPYHPDPIDTMYRPNLSELENIFPNTELILSQYIKQKAPKLSLNNFNNLLSIIRLFMPFYKYHSWLCRLLGYRQSCAMLKKLPIYK